MTILERVFPEDQSDEDRGDEWVERYRELLARVMDEEGEVA